MIFIIIINVIAIFIAGFSSGAYLVHEFSRGKYGKIFPPSWDLIACIVAAITFFIMGDIFFGWFWVVLAFGAILFFRSDSTRTKA